MVRNMVRSQANDRRLGWTYDMVIETPVGSLRQRPYMRGEKFEDTFNRTTVDYCSYGKPYGKSTDLWSTFDFKPQGLTGNGKCNNGCSKQGKNNEKGRFKHTVVIAGGNERRLKGTKVKQQVWSLPKLLTTEILAAYVVSRSQDCQRRIQ